MSFIFSCFNQTTVVCNSIIAPKWVRQRCLLLITNANNIAYIDSNLLRGYNKYDREKIV